MAKSCCEAKSCELEKLRERQKGVLKAVLAINALMFLIEFSAGLASRSSALTSDSLDMLGDALVYGFSLYVLTKGVLWRARAGLLKGLIMAAFGLGALGSTISRLVTGAVPGWESMSLVGFLALAANSICLWLLYSHRADDINMRSTWICSRNDIVANIGVICAAAGVRLSGTTYPDTVIGLVIAAIFLRSSFSVIGEAHQEIKGASAPFSASFSASASESVSVSPPDKGPAS